MVWGSVVRDQGQCWTGVGVVGLRPDWEGPRSATLSLGQVQGEHRLAALGRAQYWKGLAPLGNVRRRKGPSQARPCIGGPRLILRTYGLDQIHFREPDWSVSFSPGNILPGRA